MGMPVEPQVSYSVKEILDRIEGKMDSFTAGLAAKADASAVVQLQQIVDGNTNQLTDIQGRLTAAEKRAAARMDYRRWLIPTIISIVSLLAYLLPVFVHG